MIYRGAARIAAENANRCAGGYKIAWKQPCAECGATAAEGCPRQPTGETMTTDHKRLPDDPMQAEQWLRERAEGHAPGGDIRVYAPPATWIAIADHIAALKERLAELEGRPKSTEVRILSGLRERGWRVAVHNDYQLDGMSCTFWLFTHPSGLFVKGEGGTDTFALLECHEAVAQLEDRGLV